MQVFLPFPDFVKSLESLDNKRLGKQRVETYQLISGLTGRPTLSGKPYSKSRINHPISQMFRDNIPALKQYLNDSIDVWVARGMNNTMVKEVIDEDSKKENFEVKEGTTNIENRLVDITNMILKLSDSIVSLDNKISRISADNEKKDKEIEKRMKDINVDKIIGKIEDMFSTTIENNIEVSKKMLAEIDSKNETLEILKEDIDETCDKYYEIYKKFKNITEDMEDMFRSRRK
jgi:methyl-accepting chemotaxis protein